MELVRKRGSPPRFPFLEFQALREEYDNGPKLVWESREDLDRAATREIGGKAVAVALQQQHTTILGHIEAETAKKWKAWGLGRLYAVGYYGAVLFCLPGGVVVA